MGAKIGFLKPEVKEIRLELCTSGHLSASKVSKMDSPFNFMKDSVFGHKNP